MESPDLAHMLSHDESLRAVCARVEDKSQFCIVSNAEIALPETNCVTRVRLAESQVDRFLSFVCANGLPVVCDPATSPGDLPARLVDAGYTGCGRRTLAVLDPEALVNPPGRGPAFTPVGPTEHGRFTELILGEIGDAARLLWSFRLRNLLFSAYLAESEDGPTGAFVLFHADTMARIEPYVPAGEGADFNLGCRCMAKAWERARQKGCTSLYGLVGEPGQPFYESLGFAVDRDVWLEAYAHA